jgi:hypothetical protein
MAGQGGMIRVRKEIPDDRGHVTGRVGGTHHAIDLFGSHGSLRRWSMVGWTVMIIGIMLIGVVVVFKWKQRAAGHIAYWQQ